MPNRRWGSESLKHTLLNRSWTDGPHLIAYIQRSWFRFEISFCEDNPVCPVFWPERYTPASEQRADKLNQIQVNIIRAETQSGERGLDLCKWTETWAPLESKVFQKSWRNTSVAGGISCFQTSFVGQRWTDMTIARRGPVIRHMPALNVIMFWRRLLVHICFSDGPFARSQVARRRAKPLEHVGKNLGQFWVIHSLHLHPQLARDFGGRITDFLPKIFSNFANYCLCSCSTRLRIPAGGLVSRLL